MKNPSPEPFAVLRSHTSAVHSVKFVKQGVLLSASADGELKIWNLTTRRPQATLDAHSRAGILAIETISTEQCISQGRDGYIKLWNVNQFGSTSPVPIASWFCGSYTFCKVATNRWKTSFSDQLLGNLVASPSNNESTVNVIDIRAGKTIQTIENSKEENGMCMSLRLYSPSCGTLSNVAIGYESGHLKIYESRSGRFLVSSKMSDSPLLAFDINRAGDTVIGVSPESDIMKLQMDLTTLSSNVSSIHSSAHPGYADVTIRDDERIFATGGWDRRIRIFGFKKCSPLAILKHHTDSIFALEFQPGGSLLASGSKDSRVSLWDVFQR